MAEKKIKKRGLGRGLSALMADVEADTFSKPSVGRSADVALPIEKIEPNPDQPRRQFTEADLADLAASIRTKGVIQPLIVRKSPKLLTCMRSWLESAGGAPRRWCNSMNCQC